MFISVYNVYTLPVPGAYLGTYETSIMTTLQKKLHHWCLTKSLNTTLFSAKDYFRPE